MLELMTLINDNAPEIIERKLIVSLKEFIDKNAINEKQAYQHLCWILKFIRFHNGQHPSLLSKVDIESFISSLAAESVHQEAIQHKAFKAMIFLYHEFLNVEIGTCQFLQAKRRKGFGDRFNPNTCLRVLEHMQGSSLLMAKVAYYCKLRLKTVANLKVSNVDIKKNIICVYDQSKTLKYKVNIPLKIILELRIQKMRANQYLDSLKKANKRSEQSNLFLDENDFLFPSPSHLTTSCNNDTQLNILKNDISLAIKQQFRHTPAKKLANVANAQVLKTRVLFNPAQSRSHSISSDKHIPQASFNFRNIETSHKSLKHGTA